MSRIRRRCYDKPHRCPGWAGGGWRSAREVVCAGETLPGTWEPRSWWLPQRCRACGIWALPIAQRYLDPSWYLGKLHIWAEVTGLALRDHYIARRDRRRA